MSVIRVFKNKNFTVMSNIHLRDKDLSLKAKGLLSMMLSLPEDWNYSIKGLCAICKENETAVKSALNELRDKRYVILERIEPSKETGGRIQYEYFVYEQPQGEENKKVDVKDIYKQQQNKENMSGEIQGVENLGVEFLQVENEGDILNTNQSNTDLLKTDGLNKYAFSEDKSSSKVSNIYAFSPEEKEVCGTQKQNRFISADYSYEQLREHIRPVYESVLKDVYGCTADDTPIEDMLDITEGFYRLYKQEIGIKHRVLSDKAYMNLVDAFMNPPEIMNEDYMFNCEEHMKMARLYFKTDYNKQKKFKGTIEKSISHFMTDMVRSNLFNRACYYGEE